MATPSWLGTPGEWHGAQPVSRGPRTEQLHDRAAARGQRREVDTV